jgi:hypothetical protein
LLQTGHRINLTFVHWEWFVQAIACEYGPIRGAVFNLGDARALAHQEIIVKYFIIN